MNNIRTKLCPLRSVFVFFWLPCFYWYPFLPKKPTLCPISAAVSYVVHASPQYCRSYPFVRSPMLPSHIDNNFKHFLTWNIYAPIDFFQRIFWLFVWFGKNAFIWKSGAVIYGTMAKLKIIAMVRNSASAYLM